MWPREVRKSFSGDPRDPRNARSGRVTARIKGEIPAVYVVLALTRASLTADELDEFCRQNCRRTKSRGGSNSSTVYRRGHGQDPQARAAEQSCILGSVSRKCTSGVRGVRGRTPIVLQHTGPMTSELSKPRARFDPRIAVARRTR